MTSKGVSYAKKHLLDATKGAIEAAHKTKKSSARGVAEAVGGALIWTLLLLGLSIAAHRVGIDLLETYKRLYGK